jgi:hypothetical protein
MVRNIDKCSASEISACSVGVKSYRGEIWAVDAMDRAVFVNKDV